MLFFAQIMKSNWNVSFIIQTFYKGLIKKGVIVKEENMLFNPNTALCNHHGVELTTALLCGVALDLILNSGQIAGDLVMVCQIFHNS